MAAVQAWEPEFDPQIQKWQWTFVITGEAEMNRDPFGFIAASPWPPLASGLQGEFEPNFTAWDTWSPPQSHPCPAYTKSQKIIFPNLRFCSDHTRYPALTRSPLSWSESWWPRVHPTLFADTAPSSPSSLSLLHPSSLPKLDSDSPLSEDNLEHLIPLPLPPRSWDDRLECHTWFMWCWGSKPGLLCACGTSTLAAEFICTLQLHFQERIWLTVLSNQITEEANTLSPRRRFTGEASAPKMVCWVNTIILSWGKPRKTGDHEGPTKPATDAVFTQRQWHQYCRWQPTWVPPVIHWSNHNLLACSEGGWGILGLTSETASTKQPGVPPGYGSDSARGGNTHL